MDNNEIAKNLYEGLGFKASYKYWYREKLSTPPREPATPIYLISARHAPRLDRGAIMNELRHLKKVIRSRPTVEGAGVHLKRAIGWGEPDEFDPFLLLDDFRSDNPKEYVKGFPWHPHRGIETITYVLKGRVEHKDSIGNAGMIGAGDLQWMTAGSGIYHQEMPEGNDDGAMHGFQLWANLPAANKMMAPRYQDVKAANIPEVVEENGVRIKVIAGRYRSAHGPIKDTS